MKAKSIFTKQLNVLFFVGLIVVLFSGISQGATYYVSPDGNYSWVESTNINTRCSVSTAMSNAVAGDTVYFRGGMYDVGDSPSYTTPALNPANSGLDGSPIVFKAFPGESVTLKVSDSCSNCQAAIGSYGRNYITWDGFTVDQSTGPVKWKGLLFHTAQYCIVRNCVFIGKTVSTSDNVGGVRLDSANNALVQNCKFYNYRQVSNWHNTSAIKMYRNNNIIIENCEIYNCSNGLYPKDGNDNCTYRYNYIHDCYLGIYVAADAGSSSDNCKFYHNVLANNTSDAFNSMCSSPRHFDNWDIYNNTLYSDGGIEGLTYSTGAHYDIYNNIIQGFTSKQLTGRSGATLKECDHNCFGNATFQIITRKYAEDQGTYLSLSSWQNFGELEDNSDPGNGSLASDPKFVNTSGNMNQLDDFKLANDSPCKGTGRGGIDMGADISQVGPEGSPPAPGVPGDPPWFIK